MSTNRPCDLRAAVGLEMASDDPADVDGEFMWLYTVRCPCPEEVHYGDVTDESAHHVLFLGIPRTSHWGKLTE